MQLLQIILPVALFALRVNLVRARVPLAPSPNAITTEAPAESGVFLMA